MKPQSAKSHLVDETDQVVTPPRVGHFMDEDRVELPVIQHSIDAKRKRDVRTQDSIDRRSLRGRG